MGTRDEFSKAATQTFKEVSEPWRRLGISQRDWTATQGIMDDLHSPAGLTESEYLDKLKRDLLGPFKVEEDQHLADTAAGAKKAIEVQGWWKAPGSTASAWETAAIASKTEIAGLAAAGMRDELIQQDAVARAAKLEALREPR